jgi:hypothetical protein
LFTGLETVTTGVVANIAALKLTTDSPEETARQENCGCIETSDGIRKDSICGGAAVSFASDVAAVAWSSDLTLQKQTKKHGARHTSSWAGSRVNLEEIERRTRSQKQQCFSACLLSIGKDM